MPVRAPLSLSSMATPVRPTLSTPSVKIMVEINVVLLLFSFCTTSCFRLPGLCRYRVSLDVAKRFPLLMAGLQKYFALHLRYNLTCYWLHFGWCSWRAVVIIHLAVCARPAGVCRLRRDDLWTSSLIVNGLRETGVIWDWRRRHVLLARILSQRANGSRPFFAHNVFGISCRLIRGRVAVIRPQRSFLRHRHVGRCRHPEAARTQSAAFADQTRRKLDPKAVSRSIAVQGNLVSVGHFA